MNEIIIGIDPGIYSGIAVFQKQENDKYHMRLYGVCYPTESLIVQECLEEVTTLFDGYGTNNCAMVIEDQRAGAMGLNTIKGLIRRREKWQCLAETMRIPVVDVKPSVWQSWAYKRKRPEDAKIATIQRVNKLFGLSLSSTDIMNNAADAINIADWFVRGNTIYDIGPYDEYIWQPHHPVKIYKRMKRRDGSYRTIEIWDEIIGATRTKYKLLILSELKFLRTPTLSTRAGVARAGNCVYEIASESIDEFETYISHSNTWP